MPIAQTLLESDQLKSRLPRLERIFDVPLPLIDPENGELTVPRPGYDARFQSYLVEGAPEIREMGLAEAKGVVKKLIQDFCFRGEQDVVHAIAALLTPMCRGLYDRWTSRTPVFFFLGNRPRTGKDYLAGCVSILYEGRTNEDPPLDRDQAELRKKLTAAMISGRRRMHFSNCDGVLKNPVLEQVVTNERWSDRVLGGNNEVSIPNEMEFSLSGNTGVLYTPDFSARSRFINLHFAHEYENKRTFTEPDLHGWLLRNRAEVLSALWTFVREWNRKGRPAGTTPLTSFPSWASIVGGIMKACDLGDPCLPHVMEMNTGGDNETRDMKRLYGIAYDTFPEKWVVKHAVRKLVVDNHESEDAEPLFSYLDIGDHSGKVRFGRILDKFVGREFDGIQMLEDGNTERNDRRKLKYTKVPEGPSDSDPVAAFFDGTSATALKGGGSGSLGGVVPSAIPEKDGETDVSVCVKGEKSISETAEPAITAMTASYELVDDRERFAEIAKEINSSGQAVALDCETYGEGKGDALDPFKGGIRLVSLAIPGRKPWIIDLKATGADLGPVKDALSEAGVIIHNALFDLRFLGVHCDLRLKKATCTMTASRLLNAGRLENKSGKLNSLGRALSDRGIVDLPKELGKSDWGGALSDGQLEYAANDVCYLHQLRDKLLVEINEAGLSKVWKLEMDVLPVAVEMSITGLMVDAGKLETLGDKLSPDIETVSREALELLGKEINLNSTKQLKAALNDLGFDLGSTDKATLAQLDHPVAVKLLEYRRLNSQKKTVETLKKHVSDDGRLHGTFDPSGSESGRFSCKDPNLQSISRGPVREAIRAPQDYKLVCADYSQIELRIAAVVRKEEKMLEAYRKGEDLHRVTAAYMCDKDASEVTPEERQMAKAVNFGLLYGQYPKGLARYAKESYGVDMTEGQAEKFHRRFFESYPAMRNYASCADRWASNNALNAVTRLGRRKYLPDGEDYRWTRYTSLLNAPVQGGAADVLKTALVRLAAALPDNARIVSTVHDEIIVECPEAIAPAVKAIMEGVMTGAMNHHYPEVPCEVEAKSGQTWAEAK